METKRTEIKCLGCGRLVDAVEETQVVMEEWEDGTRHYYKRGYYGVECGICHWGDGGPVSQYLGTEEEYIASQDDHTYRIVGEDNDNDYLNVYRRGIKGKDEAEKILKEYEDDAKKTGEDIFFWIGKDTYEDEDDPPCAGCTHEFCATCEHTEHE